VASIAILSSAAAASPNAPLKATGRAAAALSGRVQLLLWSDPQNQGDVPDASVVPDGSLKKEWGMAIHLNASLGGRFAYPEPIGGFTFSGQVLTAVQIRRIFSVPSAGFLLEHRAAGVKIGAGKFVQPTVSALSPSSFQFSSNWGNLLHATTGAYVAKSHGKLLAQIGFGRPSLPDFTEALTATAGAAPRLPFVEGRLAYIDATRVGEVPSGPVRGTRPGPLTLSLSGAFGQQRAGVGEKAVVQALVPDAAAPRIEDVTSWIVSAEALVPYAGFVLTGEAYVGKGANAYTGAVRQRPRVDAQTGAHRALTSQGGWIQLSYALPEGCTLLALGGLERVSGGLEDGLSVDGPLKIEANRLLAVSFSKDFDAGLHLGLQLQQQSTRYVGARTGTIYAVLAETSLEF
jgi:hypothetical protein